MHESAAGQDTQKSRPVGTRGFGLGVIDHPRAAAPADVAGAAFTEAATPPNVPRSISRYGCGVRACAGTANVSAGKIAPAISAARRLLMILALSRCVGVAEATESRRRSHGMPSRSLTWMAPAGPAGSASCGWLVSGLPRPWPGPRAGHGAIAIAGGEVPPTWIGVPGVLVAVLIGMTEPALAA